MDRTISLDNEILYRNIGLTPQALLNYYDAYRTSSTPSYLFPANINVKDLTKVSKSLLNECKASMQYTQHYSYSDAKQTLTFYEPPKIFSPSIQHPTFFENVEPNEVENLSDTQFLDIHINNVFHNLNIDSITSSKVTKGKHLLPRYETVDKFSLRIQSLNTLLHNPNQEKEMTYKCQ